MLEVGEERKREASAKLKMPFLQDQNKDHRLMSI
jgi:hypothetical protein